MNTVVHRDDGVAPLDGWVCVELMVHLNDDITSSAGGELGPWIDDTPIYHYTEAGPLGSHVRDKFCPADATSSSCTDYQPPQDERTEILDLQWRNTSDLRLNYIWLQNYMSSGTGGVQFDDLVVATTRVGCIR